MSSRDIKVDILKGLAIISVVAGHTLSLDCLTSIYRIFHIMQAVPLFMLVSGYVFTLSYIGSGIKDFKSCYNWDILKKRIKRFYAPFLIIYILEVIYMKNWDLLYIIKHLPLGGSGPGSYYPIIMLQFLLIFPIIYIVILKKPNYSIPIFFAIGIIFEFFAYFTGMSEDTYRLLIGRYIFAVALGGFLALNKIDKSLLYIGSILSIIYMYASIYLNYHAFGHDYWLPHQAPAYFYTALIFVTGMRFLEGRTGIFFTYLAELGKASWHIFLFQMLYFLFGFYQDSVFAVAANVLICTSIGYLFYIFEGQVYDLFSKGDFFGRIRKLLTKSENDKSNMHK